MRVVAFVGPSGSGKSHRAAWVARERDIDFIIDDGLLIKNSQIIAGSSAKREATKIASVRRALFLEDTYADEIRKALKEHSPDAILILGTSDSMTEKIAERLKLPDINERINITDVASEYEINQAISTRKEQGKHVIPVPTFQIKKDFSGYILDPLQIFRRHSKGTFQAIGEKSVVRPTFSYMGKYSISDYALRQIVFYVISEIEGIAGIKTFSAENLSDGVIMDLGLVLYYGHVIKPLLRLVQSRVAETVERLTALNIIKLTVTAVSLDLK